jgi:hypothetical protein
MVVAAACTLASPTAGVEPSSPPPAQPTPVAPDPKQEEARTTPSTLDDLLGIEEDDAPAADAASGAAAQTRQKDLDNALAKTSPSDALSQAVARMGVSAQLLDGMFDPGLGTQRVQQEILAKLDELIEMAQNNPSSSSSSSSSGTSSSPARGAPKPSPQPGKPNAGARNDSPTDSAEGDSPLKQQDDINTAIDESRTEWGSLPPRVRDMMLQGRGGRFSSLYQRLTEEYYKRLAEEVAR